MNATIHLRLGQLRKYRAMSGLTSDSGLADRMGAHRATVHRALRGDGKFSLEFVASLLRAFPQLDFSDLFEIVDNDEPQTQPRTGAA